ncbi:MAG: ABC transporter ATP-binding protein [Planctomycetota bacterium]
MTGQGGEDEVIRLCGIEKVYRTGGVPVTALHPLDLSMSRGHFVAIMGPSGSGKSTLLNLLGMLDRPTQGEYFLAGENVAELDDDALSHRRCHRMGFVFQAFNLMAKLSILENVCVPMQYAEVDPAEMHDRANELLKRVGLGDRVGHRPTQLSGGQCQRVAIARALANDPPIILADEPTGNLDEKTGNEILEIFHELCAQGRTIIMVTHNPEYESIVERVVVLHDGRITRDTAALQGGSS